jgi:hypothetical protein
MKHGDGWRASLPELTVAAMFVAALAGAAYAWAGADGAAVVTGACALGALVLLRALPVPGSGLHSEPGQAGWRYTGQRTIGGFWRKRASVQSAIASLASYDLELRATLQHLLAARLAERHGISLYADPAAARRLFQDGRTDDDSLWQWLDPAQDPAAGDRPHPGGGPPDPPPPHPGGGPPDPPQPGIPPRTLAAILHRLEHL